MKYLLLFFSSLAFAQQTQFVDFVSVSADLTLNPNEKIISGDVNYNFAVLKSIDTIKIDAQNMTFSDLKMNGNEIKFINTGKQLHLIYPFKKGKNKLTFKYSAKPKQTLYFVDSFDTNKPEAAEKQIWTQGQGRYTSHWFPSFDDVNEKVAFSLAISYDANYQVISNGVLKHKVKNNNSVYWKYQMQKPMSSYLLMLAIGKFEKQIQKSNSGIPLEMYLENKDVLNFEPTYRYSVQMFDFLEKEIGVKYPWKIYKQAPVRDFLYAGMENTTATLFSTRYVVDTIGFEDRSYTNVNAHELAHQWFGDLVTADSGKHHWLQEGFATYYALLAEREIYGEDYFYFKLYESAQQLKFASRTDTIPVLNPKASSLTFYQKGAWALHVLREAIGEKAFRKAVKKYLKKHAFHSVTTSDFFQEIKKTSNFDLDEFSKVWLETSEFNTMQSNSLLMKNKSIQILIEIEKLKNKPLVVKKDFFAEILKSDAYFSLKQAIVNQLKNEKFEDKKALLNLALKSKSLQVRQAVAATVTVIPEEFRVQYETLLNDESYQTQELALYNLWNNFPDSRFTYLNNSKNWIGFNDYNLRTLWLSLALSTPNYLSNKEPLIKELTRYSSSRYEANIRQDALEKLIAFKIINDEVLHNLVNATTHHMWQFSKFGRDTIRKLLKTNTMRSSFEGLLPVLSENEQFQLNRLLKE
jgi:aminopeptidase N